MIRRRCLDIRGSVRRECWCKIVVALVHTASFVLSPLASPFGHKSSEMRLNSLLSYHIIDWSQMQNDDLETLLAQLRASQTQSVPSERGISTESTTSNSIPSQSALNSLLASMQHPTPSIIAPASVLTHENDTNPALMSFAESLTRLQQLAAEPGFIEAVLVLVSEQTEWELMAKDERNRLQAEGVRNQLRSVGTTTRAV